MRVLSAIVVAAFLGVLGFIAYDLHRVANVMVVSTGIDVPAKAETLAEHDAKLRAQMKLLDHDAEIIWEPIAGKKHQAAPVKSK